MKQQINVALADYAEWRRKNGDRRRIVKIDSEDRVEKRPQ